MLRSRSGTMVSVVGINWRSYAQQDFDKIVEVLLRREFGLRGNAVNGRGGDKGVDYSVDGGKIIFQFKFFPEGFSSNHPSRRSQIAKSFRTAIENKVLEEWVLVVPNTLTPPERRFVSGLGKGKSVKISIRDDTWLTDVLATAENKDLLNHFLYASDIEYLHSRAAAFANNPVVRDSRDIVARLKDLQESVDLIDTNYSLEFYEVDGELVQRLVPKDPAALTDAPVSMSFVAEVPGDHPQLEELDLAADYGLADDFVVGVDMIKNLTVTGTSLINEADPGAGFVVPASTSDWQPTEVMLKDGSGARIGIYLGKSRIRSRGPAGVRLELNIQDLASLTFFVRRDEESCKVALTTRSDENATPSAVFETADFLLKSDESQAIEIRVKKQTVLIGDVVDAPPALLREATVQRQLADDLRVIEDQTLTKFRYPLKISLRDRLTIRNIRLMLEGHCVAHPDATILRFTLNGHRGPELERILTTAPMWMLATVPSGLLDLLDEEIHLPAVSRAALVSLPQEEVDAAREAVDRGEGDGHVISLRVRPGDRIRLFIQGVRDPDLPVEITPWGLEGVSQQGLGPTGESLARQRAGDGVRSTAVTLMPIQPRKRAPMGVDRRSIRHPRIGAVTSNREPIASGEKDPQSHE